MTSPLTFDSLPAGFEPLAEYPQLVHVLIDSLALIEDELREALANADQVVEEASRHLLEAGGKRVRPLLTLLASFLGDPQVATGEVSAPNAEVRTIAVALELTHVATLYHDDVMDEADTRRGAPAAHKQYSNSVAILAGDLIFARASNEMSSMGEESIKVHSHTFEQLVMGQLWETLGPRPDQDPLEHYLAVLDGKTASLISASAKLGALKGGCDAQTVAMLEEYGTNVGMAFQLADDIIDVVAPAEVSGKVPGTDLKERVPTLPTLVLRRLAAEEGEEQAARAIDLVDGPLETDEQVAAAVEAVASHERALAESWALAGEWSDKAVDSLRDIPDSPVKDALVAFAKYVVTRSA